MRNLIIDTDTNRSFVRGRGGREYTMEQVAAAEATPDEPASRALLDDIEYPDATGMQELLHDCPECRAAMARGEQPTFGGAEEIEALMKEARLARSARFAKRPRWRAMKRRH